MSGMEERSPTTTASERRIFRALFALPKKEILEGAQGLGLWGLTES